ncbi:YciI family protein [Streptomyces niger]|uniref:YciI family protein n=1 Tax=Streptomyces niger TaxID=66373 RepID=UPI000B00C508|nr:YciI family protein [Streptomyces niger]
MAFFCYHRDRPGSLALRLEFLEQHLSYMDRYASEMIARGPTLSETDGDPTGSVHILDLPDANAARAFAFDEPGYQLGVYRDVLLRRWRDLLGRTMWEFPGDRTGGSADGRRDSPSTQRLKRPGNPARSRGGADQRVHSLRAHSLRARALPA